MVEEIDARLGKTVPAASPQGQKTAARITKLKEILKARGGSQTFKKLQEDHDLSPSEFTYLVGCLDKRSFEVGRRPGTEERGEGPEPQSAYYGAGRFQMKSEFSQEDKV